MVAVIANAQPTGFVTRQDRNEVVTVDLSNGTVLGAIPTLDTSPFEIALSPDASTLYVTHTGDNAVNILDVASASTVQRVGVGNVPIEITLLPDGSKLYTADFFGGTVSVIDTVTRSNVATIPTAFLSYDVATAPDGTRVYATALSATNIFVIDTASDMVVDSIPVGGDFMGHIAITPDGQKAYVTEFRNQVNVIDLASKTVIGIIPFNSDGANPNNGALDIAIDPQGTFAYVLGYDTVNVIDLATDTLLATVPVGIQLSDVAVDSTGTFVYVTTLYQDTDSVPLNEIVKIETNGFTIQDRFVIGGLLVGLAVGPSAIPVEIDIKPGSEPNSINPRSRGKIPVAILTTDTFDASTVDPSMVLFGASGSEGAPVQSALEDVDGDGDIDMILHFKTQETGIQYGDTSASLTGGTTDGQIIQGSNCIKTVGDGGCFPPPTGLTGWWPGDYNTDDILGGRNAKLWGDATIGHGLIGGAFVLDGDGDFVDVPDDEALNVKTGDFTVDLWVLFNDTAGEQVLIEKWVQRFPNDESEPGSEGWTLTKPDGNVLLLAMADGTGEIGVVSDELPIAAGTWTHFAATRRGSQVTLFMNGVPVAQGESLLNLDSTSSLKFGHRGNPDDTEGSQDDSGFYLNGRIDEVHFFVGQALTHCQIQAIFNARRAGMCK